MGRSTKLQSSFSAGVLDPRLAARQELASFYEGMSVGTNILCTPQGGVRRRPGMPFVADIGEIAALWPFAFSTTQTYLMVFTLNNIAVYKDDVWQADITTTFTAAQLPDIRITQSADTMLIFHESHQTQKLVRGASHSSWTLSTITYTNIPPYDFDQDYAGINFTPAVTTGTGINLTASSAIFTADDVGGQVRGNGGVATIAGFTSTTIVTIDITTDFDDTSAIAGVDFFLGEPALSSTRGWPKVGTFFEGRLWLGGTTDGPQSLIGSVTNDFFNLDLGDALADEAIFATLDTDEVNAINGIFAGRHLQVFTSGGEFYCPATPITPANFTMKRQTIYGSTGLPPLSIDGTTMFMDRSGKTLREFLFTYVEEAYGSNPLSMRAPHLISAPVSVAAQRGASGDEANYVYLVNDDGTMAVLNTLRSEGITAWTRWETAGNILAVTVVVDVVYFLVQRTINSVTEYYLEKADFDTYTDSNVSKTQASSVTVTGLGHLNGEESRVKADGAVMANNTPSGGSITVERAVEDIEVGLDFNPTVTTMPLNIQYQDGPSLTKDKRVTKVQVDMYESLGIYVDDILLPDRKFGENVLDTTPAPYTGLREVYLLGWTELATVTITQQDPVPMTIRALAIEVEG